MALTAHLSLCVMLSGLILDPSALPANADDPPGKLTPAERKELDAKREELNDSGVRLYQAGNYPQALRAFQDALEAAHRLYPKDEYPDGTVNLAMGLNNVAAMYQGLGKLTEAADYAEQALAMRKKLNEADHPDLVARR